MSDTRSRSPAPHPGVYVPAVVFFKEDGSEELDIPPTVEHVLRLAKGGVAGILIQGSNGEAQHLSRDERKQLITLARNTLDSNGFQNVLVIAGTGAQSTRETVQLCKDAQEAGAVFTLVLTPSTWSNSMSTDAILRFHCAVADASPIPTMIYNFPTVTAGLDLDSDIISTLAKHPNIVGTKLSCGNIGKLNRITSRYPASEFAVFPGTSSVFAPGLLCNSAGLIGALVNLFPKCHVHLHNLWREGKVEEAMLLQNVMGHADWAVGRLGGIGALKGLVTKHFGYGNGRVRGPLMEVNAEKLSQLDGSGIEELVVMEKKL